MKYRLKVKSTKTIWKIGINIYNTLEEANVRVKELEKIGITSKVIKDNIETY